MSAAGTSFYQFLYCGLCKLNHKQRKKKHIYSQRHQSILKNVISKFKKKIENVRRSVVAPEVNPLGWESGAKVWCYFCQCEVSRHQGRQECTVSNAVLIHHLAHKDHTKKMHEFFWENLIDASKKVDFIISNEEENRFFENAEKAVENYLKKQKEKILQEASQIKFAEQQRQAVQWTALQQQLVRPATVTSTESECSLTNTRVRPRTIEDSNTSGLVGKKTVSAFGPGLSCVSLPQDGDLRHGNVYTGATPPWLLEDKSESGGEIGPTADTYAQHYKDQTKKYSHMKKKVQLLQKQKLPACRVGAAFNHKVDTSTQWLPTFGRVWNNGRRLNSKQQFLKGKARGLVKKDSAVPTAVPSSVGGKRQHTEHHQKTLCASSPFSSVAAGVSVDTQGAESDGPWLDRVNLPKRRDRLECQTPLSSPAMFNHNADSLSSAAGSSGLQSYSSDSPWQSQASAASYRSHSDNNNPVFSCAMQPTSDFSWQPQATTSTVSSSTKHVKEIDGTSAVCRPYKRQRKNQMTSPLAVSATLIPITPKLLSAPVQHKNHASSSVQN